MSLAGSLIETARVRAGLSQAELARRAKTSQAAIALYESDKRSPTVATLERVLAAAGYELRVRLEPVDDHDLVLDRWLSTIPAHERERFEAAQRRRVQTT